MADEKITTAVTTDDKEKLKQLEITANVIIIPKPRFYTIVACALLFIVLLWNQSLLVNTFKDMSYTYCRAFPNEVLKLPVPTPTPPISKTSPPVVVPYTPSQDPSDLASIRDLRRFYLSANEVDGRIVLRTGGSISWRFNNPGKMIISDFTKSMGSIGSDGTTAIFPSYDIGRKAMEAYLFTPAAKYYDKKISEIFPEDTLRLILEDSGLSRDDVLNTLNVDQKNKLMDAIQKVQGFIPGKVTVFKDESDFKKRGW